jgi:DNA-binding transcriptional ArsR family regulator
VTNSSGQDQAGPGGGIGDQQAPANIDVLKALADPIRLNLLYVLTHRKGTALPIMSVKELAAALGEPQTKLYRHVKHLESAGLISAVASRVVSGIVEQRYQASHPEIVIGDTFTEQERISAEAEGMTAAAFELYRRQFFAARRVAAADPANPAEPEPLLGISDGRLPAARAAAIRDELYRIFEEISAARHASSEADEDAETVPVSMLVGYFRMNQD